MGNLILRHITLGFGLMSPGFIFTRNFAKGFTLGFFSLFGLLTLVAGLLGSFLGLLESFLGLVETFLGLVDTFLGLVEIFLGLVETSSRFAASVSSGLLLGALLVLLGVRSFSILSVGPSPGF